MFTYAHRQTHIIGSKCRNQLFIPAVWDISNDKSMNTYFNCLLSIYICETEYMAFD